MTELGPDDLLLRLFKNHESAFNKVNSNLGFGERGGGCLAQITS